MCSGVGKSGSPAPNPITFSPAAFRALAFASTARVGDSAMADTLSESRFWGMLRPYDTLREAPGHSSRPPAGRRQVRFRTLEGAGRVARRAGRDRQVVSR